jgi:hypothetical protein
MTDGLEKASEVQNQWSSGFTNVRCKGDRKRRPVALRGTDAAIACADLLYRVKIEGHAVVVEVRCKECKTYSIRKFRPRRDEQCLTES